LYAIATHSAALCVGTTPHYLPDSPCGWEEKLASDSEAIVKAERCSNESIEEMQKLTIEVIEVGVPMGGGVR
jgi:hypothetical protein